jgi:hypothetical protein
MLAATRPATSGCHGLGMTSDMPGSTRLVTTQRCLPIFRFLMNPSFS